MPPSQTWFSADPHWTWLVVIYFYFGAIAAGSLFIAAVVDLVGTEADKWLGRLGYLIAFPITMLDAVFLVADLGRPDRFTNMLLMTEVSGLVVKPWSPISFGAWGFGLLCALTAAACAREVSRRKVFEFGVLQWFDSKITGTIFDKLFLIACAVVGLVMVTYPGVLLNSTNRPFWGDTSLLALFFAISALALAGASIVLFGNVTGTPIATSTMSKMSRFTQGSIVGALAVLVVMALSLGSILQVWLNGWGVLMIAGTVMTIAGLATGFRSAVRGATPVVACFLVLGGGLLMRTVIIMATEGVRAVIGGGHG